MLSVPSVTSLLCVLFFATAAWTDDTCPADHHLCYGYTSCCEDGYVCAGETVCLGGGAIAGIVIGSIFGLAVFCGCCYGLFCSPDEKVQPERTNNINNQAEYPRQILNPYQQHHQQETNTLEQKPPTSDGT